MKYILEELRATCRENAGARQILERLIAESGDDHLLFRKSVERELAAIELDDSHDADALRAVLLHCRSIAIARAALDVEA